MTICSEGDAVALRVDPPENGLVQGMRGTIVAKFMQPVLAYETEFADDGGHTIVQLPLTPEQVDLSHSAPRPCRGEVGRLWRGLLWLWPRGSALAMVS